MSIVVFGSRGQLGSELVRQLEGECLGLDIDDCDLCQPAKVRDILRKSRATCVINCAAYTQVDAAETSPEVCWRVNARAVRDLADTCEQLSCALVQVSTDYVFSGNEGRGEPYREAEQPIPIGEYAKSKQMAEEYAGAWRNSCHGQYGAYHGECGRLPHCARRCLR